jgi:hypothetical protein
MNPLWIPILALSIPIFAMAFTFGNRWMAMKERMIVAERGLAIEKAAQYAAHTEALEARVRVLERIVTDKGYDVAAAIEALRDSPALPQHDAATRTATRAAAPLLGERTGDGQ